MHGLAYYLLPTKLRNKFIDQKNIEIQPRRVISLQKNSGKIFVRRKSSTTKVIKQIETCGYAVKLAKKNLEFILGDLRQKHFLYDLRFPRDVIAGRHANCFLSLRDDPSCAVR